MALLIAAFAAVMGVWIRDSIRKSTQQSLEAILASNVAAIETWLRSHQTEIQQIAQLPPIDSAAHDLLDRHSVTEAAISLDQLRNDDSFRALDDALRRDANVGWVLIDDDRMVVASNIEGLLGETVAIPEDAWRRLRSRSVTVTRPFRMPRPVRNSRNATEVAAAMFAIAPIKSGGRVLGGLAFVIDPTEEFARFMMITRRGESGETYAFDRAGTLLSPSRFDDQLRAAGLLDPDPASTSSFTVAVRDPGVDITGGKPVSSANDSRPLTLMADQATRGATGHDLDGYNGYRGVKVVGAWRWLPEYGFGVATEMDVSEAYAPLRWFRRASLTLLALLGMAAFGVTATHFYLSSRDARRRSDAGTGRRLGQYHLDELVGRGGMGAVYRGTHQLLRREVAIKVLEGREVTAQSVSRFEREVQMTARLRHPNTVDIYDYGHADDDTFFYVMEYIDGITLQDLVDRFGRQPPPRVIHLLLQICGSLSEAHHLGMIHRDVKPSNILLTAGAGLYDMIKVLDFGLVKEIDRETVNLTQSDGITGTPMYMSPEAVRDAATANQQSDLYSVGAVGYTLLTGMPTFDGESSVDVCWKQLNEDPVRPCDRIGAELPDDLQNVLMSCLRKDPRERPMSIEDLEAALRQCDDSGAWSAADALRWWEMEFQQSNDPVVSVNDDGGTLTGREGSGTTAS